MLMATGVLRDGLKGRPPPRQCPDDFDVMFVEQGRDGCEAWYRARKTTITRWLIERGKEDLIARRAAYVKHLRSQGKWLTRSTRLVETRRPKAREFRETIRDRRKVSYTLARHAAQYLRIVRNGGIVVSQAPNGNWRVGTRQMSAAQMLDFAVSKGFDSASAKDADVQPDASMKVGGRQGSNVDRSEWNEEWYARFRAQRINAELGMGADWQDDEQ